MKILAITQARVGSSRLEKKILKKINNSSLLKIHLERIKKSKNISKLVIATTNENESEKIVKIGINSKIESYRGSLKNVLKRFYDISVVEQPDWIVRLTSDCPLIDPDLIDEIVQFSVNNDFDYVSNTLKPSYPDGLDVEVFKNKALKVAYKNASLKSEQEHVTPYIWKNSTFFGKDKFMSANYKCKNNFSKYRLTVDYVEDLNLVSELIKKLGVDLSWKEYVNYLNLNSNLLKKNNNILRNDGYLKSINDE